AFKGRVAILEVHAKGKPLGDDVDLEVVARQTPGFTGADLANLINESALLAARRDKKLISKDELDEAIVRIIAGPERRSLLISDDEKKITAYHETGHALVGWALPHADPVHKVTIIPRGRSMGHTQSLPSEDKFYMRRSELVDRLAVALGGRVAEEIVFGDPTTGASNDIETATLTARQMVMEWGMSDRLGPMQYGKPEGEVFLGRDYGRRQDYSDEIAALIDQEVRKLIAQAHEEARSILTTHRDALELMTQTLLDEETIDADRVAELLADVPKWEHAPGGAMRIQAPAGLPAKPGDGVAAASSDRTA
ncbi:MAG: ATP-dependent metallopeptidase FtsH/Yme1/Tma family protein, partial [Acidimicrobiia bacterium]|nr:ATP-dependent metallopeptidase FtsH/Yme1/Tma family protein [Acidimicrobiia bacterium]